MASSTLLELPIKKTPTRGVFFIGDAYLAVYEPPNLPFSNNAAEYIRLLKLTDNA